MKGLRIDETLSPIPHSPDFEGKNTARVGGVFRGAENAAEPAWPSAPISTPRVDALKEQGLNCRHAACEADFVLRFLHNVREI
jgi:hypothetical protein